MSLSMLLNHERKDNQKVEIVGDCISLGTTLCPGIGGSCPLRRIKGKIERDPGITTSQVWEILHEEKELRHVSVTSFSDVPPFAIMVECLDQWNSHHREMPVRKGMMLIHYETKKTASVSNDSTSKPSAIRETIPQTRDLIQTCGVDAAVQFYHNRTGVSTEEARVIVEKIMKGKL